MGLLRLRVVADLAIDERSLSSRASLSDYDGPAECRPRVLVCVAWLLILMNACDRCPEEMEFR
jgi:hypothetical protein